jgi:serine/threonine-protein kinase
LKEAHGQDLVHRDIKPSNIMLCEHGGLYDVVKVLDFGLVKEIEQDAPEMTQENALIGTPFFTAPELITDVSVFSPSSDLYALGGVGYYLLTGSNVFEGDSAAEICAMHLRSQPVPPSQRTSHQIPSDLEMIVMACLAKQPNERPRSAAKLSEMLARCQGFGAWTQQQAQRWWLDNRSNLPMEEHVNSHSPLSDTHLFLHTGDQTRT